MKKSFTLFIVLIQIQTFAQNTYFKYSLHFNEKEEKVNIQIEFDSLHTVDHYLQIPRSAPGTYEISDYPSFIENIWAVTMTDSIINGQRGRGSILFFREKSAIKKISYDVNLRKMESDLKGGYASSKLRDNYLGLLGYSVFGTIPGFENNPIQLEITSENDWPIFTTLQPSLERPNVLKLEVEDYATLVDAQYLLGNDLQVMRVENAKIPLFVAAYSETRINMHEIGRRGLLSLQGLSKYFGYVPMPHYTLCYEFLEPFSSEHSYGFSMEHLNSMTASLTVNSAITTYEEEPQIFGIVHHMGHSWIPLRSYGKGYRPFDWGSAPIIETIWLNEGFIWYVTTIVTKRNQTINFFESVIESAPTYIKNKSLRELSQLGSSQYSGDFNIGRNLFSRGALMAFEMDEKIKNKTNNKKSFKDALLGLLNWTRLHNRGFEYNEIEPILSEAAGIDLSEVWERWQNE